MFTYLFLCSQNCLRTACSLHCQRIQVLSMQDLGCIWETIKVFSVQTKAYTCKTGYFLIPGKVKTIITGKVLHLGDSLIGSGIPWQGFGKMFCTHSFSHPPKKFHQKNTGILYSRNNPSLSFCLCRGKGDYGSG